MRVVRLAWALSTVLFMTAISVAADSPCAKCAWADRGDRFEGIARRQNSGGCCELLGVHYNRKNSLSEKASMVHLYFWQPAEATPDIMAWQPHLNYLMAPKSRKFGQGLQRFSWSREEVIAPLSLHLDTLYVLVSSASKVYFPSLLSTAEQPESAGTYTFILESGGGLDVKCTIEREVDGKLVPVRQFQHSEEFAGTFVLDWNGHDDQNKSVPGGIYVLRLKGIVETESVANINYSISFQHYDRFE